MKAEGSLVWELCNRDYRGQIRVKKVRTYSKSAADFWGVYILGGRSERLECLGLRPWS